MIAPVTALGLAAIWVVMWDRVLAWVLEELKFSD
jgi:hypothetical protein